MSHNQKSESREAVIKEALTWLRTPFHHQARIKGVGVGCGTFLAEVYEKAGVCNFIDLSQEYYSLDWHLHERDERYLNFLLKYTKKVEGPQKADVALFKFGRTFSHSAIIIDWPVIVHAHWRHGVILDSAETGVLLNRSIKFLTPFK